jgi:hypothetical protein
MVSMMETAAAAIALRGGSGSETSFSNLKILSVDSRVAYVVLERSRDNGNIPTSSKYQVNCNAGTKMTGSADKSADSGSAIQLDHSSAY